MQLTAKIAMLYGIGMEERTPIQRACDAVGGQSALARLIDMSPSFMAQVVQRRRPLPIDRCAAIERVTGKAVTRRDLRPSDWWLIWPELVTDEHPIPAPAEATS